MFFAACRHREVSDIRLLSDLGKIQTMTDLASQRAYRSFDRQSLDEVYGSFQDTDKVVLIL